MVSQISTALSAVSNRNTANYESSFSSPYSIHIEYLSLSLSLSLSISLSIKTSVIIILKWTFQQPHTNREAFCAICSYYLNKKSFLLLWPCAVVLYHAKSDFRDCCRSDLSPQHINSVQFHSI